MQILPLFTGTLHSIQFNYENFKISIHLMEQGNIANSFILFFEIRPLGTPSTIREIPDHATFRGKGVNTGLVRQTWGLSLFGPM